MQSRYQSIRTCWVTWLVVLFAHLLSVQAFAFQIAPLGSSFEAKLTNEPESTLAKVAGKLGRLVKGSVHEEITELAYDCPVDFSELTTDAQCAQRDVPFASAFVIYGVRWNDLPPFRLGPDEGRGCKKFLTRGPACNTSQTIRFSTQPECWYCIFTDAEKYTANGGTIVGCQAGQMKGQGGAQGNMLSRSHYGDLQFLHSMAVRDAMRPEETREQILAWLEFAWKVSTGEIKATQKLAELDIPLMADRFSCSGWTVADLYILGRQDKLLRRLPDIAFGSVLHTVQDSFSSSHTQRSTDQAGDCASDEKYRRPGRIIEFHSYGSQDGHLHDAEDQRTAMVSHVIENQTEAIRASQMLVDLARKPWVEVKPYVACLFDLDPAANPASPGDAYKRQ